MYHTAFASIHSQTQVGGEAALLVALGRWVACLGEPCPTPLQSPGYCCCCSRCWGRPAPLCCRCRDRHRRRLPLWRLNQQQQQHQHQRRSRPQEHQAIAASVWPRCAWSGPTRRRPKVGTYDCAHECEQQLRRSTSISHQYTITQTIFGALKARSPRTRWTSPA